jgi:hypothetical protein
MTIPTAVYTELNLLMMNSKPANLLMMNSKPANLLMMNSKPALNM